MRGGGTTFQLLFRDERLFFFLSLFSLSVGDPAANKRRRPFGRHNQNTHSLTRSLSLTRENSHSDNSDRRTRRVGRGEDDTHTTDRTKTKRTQSARILIIHVPMRPDAMQQRAHLAPIEKWSLP